MYYVSSSSDYIIYHTGLCCNILNNKLKLCSLKLYSLENIISYLYNYYKVEEWIRVVILPKNPKLTHYILGEKYSLLDIKTITKFKINITSTYIYFICANGKVDILELLRNAGKLLDYYKALNIASERGHVNVLDWWLKSSKEVGLELKYNEDAINNACTNGHINVLEWWLKASKESGLELKYSENALRNASMCGDVNVLEWWLKASKESDIKLIYDEWAINLASLYGHVNVLEWWLKANKESALELKYTEGWLKDS